MRCCTVKDIGNSWRRSEQSSIDVPYNQSLETELQEVLASHLETIDLTLRSTAKLVTRLLPSIPPDQYYEWMRVCFALKTVFSKHPELGYRRFYAWSSQTTQNNFDQDAVKTLWNNARAGDVTIRTLWYFVKKFDKDRFHALQHAKHSKAETELDFQRILPRVSDGISFNAPFLSDHSKKDDHSSLVDAFPAGGCYLIQSPMGTGKSKLIKKLTREVPTVLALSSRRSQARFLAKKLKLHYYRDPGFNDKLNRLVISPESLHKLGSNRHYQIIVIDDCESLFNQLNSPTMGANQQENRTIFQQLVNNAGTVFFMDAFLSQRTIDVANDLCNGKTMTIYCNTFKPPPRKMTQLVGKSILVLSQKIVELLREGKRIYFVAASARSLNKAIDHIKSAIPDLLYLHYSSAKKPDYQNFLQEWQPVQLVATTTVITVGLDYNIKEEELGAFDHVCVHFSPSGPLVRDLFQAISRLRHPLDQYFCMISSHKRHFPSLYTRELIEQAGILEGLSSWVQRNLMHSTLEQHLGDCRLRRIGGHLLGALWDLFGYE